MDFLFIFFLILGLCEGLTGPNICSETQNYTLTSRVKYQVPVAVKTYKWCFDIPPKCSSFHTEMRDKWKVQTQQYSKLVDVCCPGFREDNEKCLPKCPTGLTGHNCTERCPKTNWGPSCLYNCRCPVKSRCDGKNGKCICLDGWGGSGCNVPKDSFTRLPPMVTKGQNTKILFDWSSPTKYPNILTTSLPTLVTSKTEKVSLESIRPITQKSSTISTTQRILNKTETITEPTTTTTTVKSIINITTVLPTFKTTQKTELLSTTGLPKVSNETVGKDGKPWVSQIEPPTQVKGKNTTNTLGTAQKANEKGNQINNTIYKVTETPQTKPSKTEFLSTLKPKESSVPTTTQSIFTKPVVTTTSGKKKIIKIENRDSDIINITIHKNVKDKGANLNVTSLVRPKSKVYTESKMVTIPVKVIFDASNMYVKAKKANFTTQKEQTRAPSFIISSSPLPKEEDHTEEIGHVLAEPEHHTLIMGSSEEDEGRRDGLYSILTATAGLAASVIFVASIIVMIVRFKRNSLKYEKSDMGHVHSMMNVSEDEQTSYLRSSYHSPIPDTSEIYEIKTTPVPFMQELNLDCVPPIMLESFRDILECHYDHPRPPRPTCFSPPEHPTYQVPRSLPRIAESVEISFPVTEAAINTLKSQTNVPMNADNNVEPVYDEIPTWSVVNSKLLKTADEAITEL